jgi:hypothetical protein
VKEATGLPRYAGSDGTKPGKLDGDILCTKQVLHRASDVRLFMRIGAFFTKILMLNLS